MLMHTFPFPKSLSLCYSRHNYDFVEGKSWFCLATLSNTFVQRFGLFFLSIKRGKKGYLLAEPFTIR